MWPTLPHPWQVAFHPFVERKFIAFESGADPSFLIVIPIDGRERGLERAGFVSDPIPFLGLDELDVLRLEIGEDAEEVLLCQEGRHGALVQRIAEEGAVCFTDAFERIVVGVLHAVENAAHCIGRKVEAEGATDGAESQSRRRHVLTIDVADVELGDVGQHRGLGFFVPVHGALDNQPEHCDGAAPHLGNFFNRGQNFRLEGRFHRLGEHVAHPSVRLDIDASAVSREELLPLHAAFQGHVLSIEEDVSP